MWGQEKKTTSEMKRMERWRATGEKVKGRGFFREGGGKEDRLDKNKSPRGVDGG